MTEAANETTASAAAASEADAKDGAVANAPEHQPNRPLPSTRTKMDSQLAILRAFAAASGKDKKPVQNGDVSDVAGINVSTVSSCNRFFADIKLIEPQGRGYVPAPAVFDFHRSWEWGPDKAAHALAPVVRESWVWTALAGRLSFKTLTDDDVIRVLADEVEAGPNCRQPLSLIIELLLAVGLVVRDPNGSIRRAPNVDQSHTSHAPKEEHQRPKEPAAAPAVSPQSAPANAMSLTMSLTVPMDQISRLGDAKRVQDFFAEWAALVNAKAAIERMITGDGRGVE